MRRRKQDVLLFLVHHRIPTIRTDHKPRRLAGLPDVEEEGYGRPTSAEAARYFNITRDTTVHTWWFNREKIFGDINITKSYPIKWPALEKELVKQFTAARENNKMSQSTGFGVFPSKSGSSYTLAFRNFSSSQTGGFGGLYGARAFYAAESLNWLRNHQKR
jgi:hypothetical protein